MSGAKGIVLAIESAVCGGSISLLRDGRETANWIGSESVSKAENLLPNIDALLAANNVSRREIKLIASIPKSIRALLVAGINYVSAWSSGQVADHRCFNIDTRVHAGMVLHSVVELRLAVAAG